MLNGAWLFLFQADTVATYWIAEIVILAMLASAIYILWLSLQERLSIWELIGLRCGFSVYCGWLTAASILGFANGGKASGWTDEKLGTGTEEHVAIACLWVAWAVYTSSSYWQKNPLYAAVLFWPVSAIAAQQGGKGRVNIAYQCYCIMTIHFCYVAVLTTWLLYNKLTHAGTKKEIKGLFY